ncbi:MAG: glutathione S-transferase domain-containing protein, partial [Halieaceae bacterium]|nr:glutathione S-transferase domain-containing protein [Halieaceae bacterium]
STPMGAMTAREFRSLLLPGMGALFSRRMCRRQVARCPYLFSVAPKGFSAGVAAQLTPPARQDFPPTHALLDDAWRGHLAAIEHVLSVQPYLMGERFTLADASAYGQLSMNLADPEARDLMEQLAPLTHAWLCSIRDGQHTGGGDELTLSRALRPLLGMIGETFLPLMVQNEQAYESALAQGENCFNEAAFCRDQSLYHGQLMGYPFRSVVKTFQVRVWRELKQQWQALDDARREELAVLFPLGSAACLDGLALEPA